MNTSAVTAEDHFPKEVPRFEPPLPAVLQGKIDYFTEATEEYFTAREALVAFWEADADALEDIVTRFSLTGGDPKLEVLIEQAGNHLERTRAEIVPKIEEMRTFRKDAAVLKIPQVRSVMLGTIDRNVKLMRRYLGAIEDIYERLIGLRDRSIQQSAAGLTEAAWAGIWDDED
jgi:hypothetical protein